MTAPLDLPLLRSLVTAREQGRLIRRGPSVHIGDWRDPPGVEPPAMGHDATVALLVAAVGALGVLLELYDVARRWEAGEVGDEEMRRVVRKVAGR
jgi:hypothetical protein